MESIFNSMIWGNVFSAAAAPLRAEFRQLPKIQARAVGA
jgi:hypothetical protein